MKIELLLVWLYGFLCALGVASLIIYYNNTDGNPWTLILGCTAVAIGSLYGFLKAKDVIKYSRGVVRYVK